MEDYKETGTCCICNKQYIHFGNNALPIKDGRCCDECNNLVIMKRIQELQNRK